jgi:PAS domain S-box-containing protein
MSTRPLAPVPHGPIPAEPRPAPSTLDLVEVLLESATDMVTILSGDGVTLWQSPSVRRILGYPAGDLVGRRILGFVHPGELESTAGMLARLGERPGLAEHGELRFRHADGSYRWLEVMGRNLLHDPHVRGLLVNSRDVTERHEADRRLRESAERFRRFFEEDLTGNFVSSPDGTILACNTAFAAIFGYASLEEAAGSQALHLHPDPEVRRAMVERLRSERRIEHVELELRRRDGTAVHVVENLVGEFGPDGELVEIRGYLFDITEGKDAERQREAALAARNRFYARMNHELRTPLYAMSLNSELLLSGACGDLSEAQREAVDRMQGSMGQLRDLVDDILDLSRLDSGRLSLSAEVVALRPFLAEVSDALQGLSGRHGVSIVLSTPDGLPPIETDRRRLRQILTHLVTSAIRWCRHPPVEVRATSRENGWTRVEVSDRGAGLPPEYRDRVFEEFLLVPGARGGGTGLELAIAQRLATLLGGSLTFNSSPGEGSTFLLDLPPRC